MVIQRATRDIAADYVVIGTGSSGAVVADGISADTATHVVVLEAGPADKDKYIRIPVAFAKLFRSAVGWDYLTEVQEQLSGREIYWPRGKMVGGSSSMNAMMWIRVHRRLRRVGRARWNGMVIRRGKEVLPAHRGWANAYLGSTQPTLDICRLSEGGARSSDTTSKRRIRLSPRGSAKPS